MKYFLRKRDNEFWLESRSENHCTVIAEQEPDVNDLTSNLSIKNCQAIERGWDLDELISESDTSHLALFTSDSHELMYDEGFKAGFQKALEILGDKKFSEDDVRRAFSAGLSIGYGRQFEIENRLLEIDYYMQSLQQDEWEVEIITEEGKDTFGNAELTWYNPKLDKKGCLILKRK